MRGGRAFRAFQAAAVVREFVSALEHGQDVLAERIQLANPDLAPELARVKIQGSY